MKTTKSILVKLVAEGTISAQAALEELAEQLKSYRKAGDLKGVVRLQKEIDAIVDLVEPMGKSDPELDAIWEKSKRGG